MDIHATDLIMTELRFLESFRWELLQVLQISWQQYSTEQARLNEWLTSKEKEVEDMQRIDASDSDNVHRSVKQLQVN